MHRHFVLKTIGARLAVIIAGFLLGFIVAEIGLFIAGYSYPSLYIVDEYRGWSLRPGVSGHGTQEGHGFVNVNDNGLRDRDYSKKKPKNTIRIAVLGDSTTEAQHVDAEDAFWSVVENRLQVCGHFKGKNIEAINFGVSAYGTTQQLITLRHFVWEYSPDIVLLAFSSNDVRDNYLNSSVPRPYFLLQDDQLILDNSFREHPEYKFKQSSFGKFVYLLVNNSRVLQLIKHSDIGKLSKSTIANLPLFSDSALKNAPQSSALDYRTEGVTPVVKNFDKILSWQLTERILIAMNQEVIENGAKFIIMVTTDPVYNPDTPKHQALNLPLHDYEFRIGNIGASSRIPVLMLSPSFRRYAYEHKIHLHGFIEDTLGVGHWNELGHDLAGTLISHFICDNNPQILEQTSPRK